MDNNETSRSREGSPKSDCNVDENDRNSQRSHSTSVPHNGSAEPHINAYAKEKSYDRREIADAPAGDPKDFDNGRRRPRFDDVNKIVVKGLPEDISDEAVKHFFEPCGMIVDFMCKKAPKGTYAFVGFSEEDAFKAALELNGRELEGKMLEIVAKDTAPSKSKECYKCGRTGHLAYQCRSGGAGNDRGRARVAPTSRFNRPTRLYNDRRVPPPRGPTNCFICGRTGHISRDCPDRRYPECRRSRSPIDRYERDYRHSPRRDFERDHDRDRYSRRSPRRERRRSPPREEKYRRSPDRRRSPPREYRRSPPRD